MWDGSVFHLPSLVFRYIHFLDVDRYLSPQFGITPQNGPNRYFLAGEGRIDDEAVAIKHAISAAEGNFFGSKRPPLAIAQLAIYVDIVVNAFLKAIGVEMKINAVDGLSVQCRDTSKQNNKRSYIFPHLLKFTAKI